MPPIQPVPTSDTIPMPGMAAVVPPHNPTIPTPSTSFLTKTQKFVEENRLLVLGAAVLAASGAGYYLYTRSPGSGSGSSEGKKGGYNKKNKKRKGEKEKEKFLKGDGAEGPLVEEIERPVEKPAVEDVETPVQPQPGLLDGRFFDTVWLFGAEYGVRCAGCYCASGDARIGELQLRRLYGYED